MLNIRKEYQPCFICPDLKVELGPDFTLVRKCILREMASSVTDDCSICLDVTTKLEGYVRSKTNSIYTDCHHDFHIVIMFSTLIV